MGRGRKHAHQKGTYPHLMTNLRQVLCPAINFERFLADFDERNLRPDENLSLCLWELKDLQSKADPS